MGEAEAQNEHRHRLGATATSLDCAARNLAASRKLSKEVELTLRKVREGLSLFAEYWNKTVQALVRGPASRAFAGSRAPPAYRLCTAYQLPEAASPCDLARWEGSSLFAPWCLSQKGSLARPAKQQYAARTPQCGLCLCIPVASDHTT